MLSARHAKHSDRIYHIVRATVITMMIIIMVSTGPTASAQSGGCDLEGSHYEWCHIFDMTLQANLDRVYLRDWSIGGTFDPAGEKLPGVGLAGKWYSGANRVKFWIDFLPEVDACPELAYIHFDGVIGSAVGAESTSVLAFDTAGSETLFNDANFVSQVASTGSYTWIATTAPNPCTFGGLRMGSGIGVDQPFYFTTITIAGFGDDPWPDAPTIEPTATDLLRPVPLDQQLDEITYRDALDDIQSASIISVPPLADVHSPISGTVIGVSASYTEYGLQVEFLSDGTVTTISNLATVYVIPGDEVEAGCIIGKAGPPYKLVDSLEGSDYSQITFSLLDNTGNYMEWVNLPDPTGGVCGDHYRSEHCLTANPNLDDGAERWTLTNSSRVKNRGYVTLYWEGDGIRQDVSIDSEGTYYVTAVMRSLSASGYTKLAATLGDVSKIVTVEPDYDNQLVVVEIGPFTPSGPISGDVYQLHVFKPDDYGSIELEFACLHEGDVQLAPGSCYFPNWQFQDGTEGWVLADGATYHDPINLATGGQVTLPDGASIAHAVQLNGLQDREFLYEVSIKAHTALDSTFVSAFGEPEPLGVYIGPDQLTELSINMAGISKNFIFQIPVAAGEAYDGQFTILNPVDATPKTVEIGSVCLYPVEGFWPGYESADYDPDEAPRWAMMCSAQPQMPTGFDIPLWLNFLKEGVEYLIRCELLPHIRALANSSAGGVLGLGYLGRYLSALVSLVADWVGRVFGVNITSMADLLAFVTAALFNWLMGQGWFRWLFDTTSYGSIVLQWGISLAQSLLTLTSNVINAILAMMRIGRRLWGYVVSGINNQNAQNIGAPSCAAIADDNPMAPFCWGMDSVNTIMNSTPALLAAGYVVAGVISWMTIQWVIKQIGKTASEM